MPRRGSIRSRPLNRPWLAQGARSTYDPPHPFSTCPHDSANHGRYVICRSELMRELAGANPFRTLACIETHWGIESWHKSLRAMSFCMKTRGNGSTVGIRTVGQIRRAKIGPRRSTRKHALLLGYLANSRMYALMLAPGNLNETRRTHPCPSIPRCAGQPFH